MTRVCSVFATAAIAVVLGWQVYDVARAQYGMTPGQAAFQLGVVGLVQFVPMLLLAPIAGVIADRYDRRKVGAFSLGIDLVMALSLGLSTALGAASLPLLLGLASLHGVARAFYGPAVSSIAPNLLPPALIPRGVGASSMAMQIGTIGGPAMGGLLYALSPALPYWIASALLATGLVMVLTIRPLPAPANNREVHPVRQIIDGFRFVSRSPMLLGCITLDLFAVLLAGATALLPVYARDILTWHGQAVGPMGLGQMRAAPAVGAAVVAVVLSVRPVARNVGVKMLWAVVVFGVATAIFGISRNYLLSLAMLAVLGAADMVSVFIRSSLIQLSTPNDMRGRVASLSGIAISASNELGEMQSGIAAALLGATGAVVFGGVGAIVVTALWSVLFPVLRQSRTFASAYSPQAANPTKEQAT
nr:MFS transporter [Novosphingobium flavum]